MADPNAPPDQSVVDVQPSGVLTTDAEAILRVWSYLPPPGEDRATVFDASVAALKGAGFFDDGFWLTPAGRAHVENVIGRLVPLTNREILSIIDSLTHTFGHGTAGIGEGALRDRLSGLLEKAQPDLTPDEATLLRWIAWDLGPGVPFPFHDDVRRVIDATRGLHKKGMVETFRWALTAAGVEALRSLEKSEP